MKIIFRADANKNIGQGHVMRCLSIADAFKREGHSCIFVSADLFAAELIGARGYECFETGFSYDDMNSELPATEKILGEEKPDIIIVDSYYVTNDYFKALKKYAKTVYLDDVYAFAYDADTLINYNVYADENKYRKLYAAAGIKLPELILGCEYAPLRKEFEETRILPVQKDRAENIMISVGGSDPLHLAMKFINEIRAGENELTDCNFEFILGALEEDRKTIEEISSDSRNIKSRFNIRDMKGAIEQSDIVISAAGSTQYEICSCGVPCISFSMADNQVEGGKKFDELGAFIYAGDAREGEEFIKRLFDILIRLIGDKDKRESLAKNERTLTDGKGAGRIVGRLLN